ncbi:NADP-dependent 3-hydroxy acid dehydrogenase YdfG [Actinocorallia herbida]|uniref:NADP-dependent 3-hydroxy acid dehydrogenase YdfG n=1 Tax=Actinocorallia herbida TaxID=58109 RepID=A0A3N1DAQ2_9ACTN|nr:SDR family NAD(P)-dependent oxidoreductase [Actinocorallia herbida]ROO90613.1 NADP-dependent 3-hydroxy acid dehydrogenase YdfG [Actinocorallia herbida]
MTTRIALVTGANRGLGFESARALAGHGFTVLVGARSAERGQEAAARITAEGGTARCVPLDVADDASVAAAADLIGREYGRLDVLINNAGITTPPDVPPADHLPSRTTADTVRRTYETNVFGAIRTIGALLPLLREAPAARIVNVSSGLGSLTIGSDRTHPYHALNFLPYCSSKTALNGVTLAYAKELADTPIKVNSADPGYCATDLNGHSGVRKAEEGAADIVRLALLDADGPTGGFYGEGGERLPW